MNQEERETVQAAQAALIELNNWLVCGAISSAGDMAQSFPAMQELTEKTIISLKAVLAQPRQEPAGIVGTMPGTGGFTMVTFKASDVPVGTAIYTHPEPAPA